MGSGSACMERTGTSRSCPSRASPTGSRAATRGRSARRRWRPGRKRVTHLSQRELGASSKCKSTPFNYLTPCKAEEYIVVLAYLTVVRSARTQPSCLLDQDCGLSPQSASRYGHFVRPPQIVKPRLSSLTICSGRLFLLLRKADKIFFLAANLCLASRLVSLFLIRPSPAPTGIEPEERVHHLLVLRKGVCPPIEVRFSGLCERVHATRRSVPGCLPLRRKGTVLLHPPQGPIHRPRVHRLKA